MFQLRFLAFCGAVIVASSSDAAVVPFLLLDDADVLNEPADDLEASGSTTLSGLTLSVATSSTITGASGSSFNANKTTAGVDSAGVTAGDGDEASELDAGETLTFTVSFSDLVVALNDVNFIGAGGASDSALVTIGGSSFVLVDGLADFNGGTDTWTPSGRIDLASGSTLVFTAEDSYGFQSISFDVTAVPEPSSITVLMAGSVGIMEIGRKRKRRV
ncbi:hypothetical protein [Novipirellula artificiosorum]|uniref:PEP-CTERM protein-sorting domain-containing protein n=1 Tax=Novipirellula artificiosorum TaxID=2528016 RepID=A0A5C6E176_9BACT|nr:hypothetical protein [Novipirellula artificiosorum]TWU42224.1 hypothetical protein Poly41_05200 [Novipirellula artificiosorum]